MAAEDLQDCVKEILCGLSSAVLKQLKILIDGQIAILETAITALQAQILQYDILSKPIEAANIIFQAGITKVKKASTLIPLDLITDCVDLGDYNLNVQQTIDLASSTTNELTSELSRLLSFKEELNALVTDLTKAVKQFTDITDIIDRCLIGD